MPVILTTADECEAWLTGTVAEALELRRPLPDELLRVLAISEKSDGLAIETVGAAQEPMLSL